MIWLSHIPMLSRLSDRREIIANWESKTDILCLPQCNAMLFSAETGKRARGSKEWERRKKTWNQRSPHAFWIQRRQPRGNLDSSVFSDPLHFARSLALSNRLDAIKLDRFWPASDQQTPTGENNRSENSKRLDNICFLFRTTYRYLLENKICTVYISQHWNVDSAISKITIAETAVRTTRSLIMFVYYFCWQTVTY